MSPTRFQLPTYSPVPISSDDFPPADHLKIQLQHVPRSSAVEYLARSTPQQEQKDESPLLKAIKGALRGQDTDLPGHINTSWLHDEENPDGRELTWTSKQVALSEGGIMIKRWSFIHDREEVQYACLGRLEQFEEGSHTHYLPEESTTEESPNSRPTFGPFSRRDSKRSASSDKKTAVPAVFIFLRSLAKIYLQTGISFTVNIPFVVRRAWPLRPHGVLIQRVLEPTELEEAMAAGEDVLPTIFTITSPFQEPSAVGHASYLEELKEGHVKVQTDGLNVLRSIPPTEMVLWASHPPQSKEINPKVEKNKSLVVTIDTQRHTLSIWAYTCSGDSPTQPQIPLDPAPPTLPRLGQRQPSAILNHGRRTSAGFEGERLDSKHHDHPMLVSKELNADGFPIVTGLPSLSTIGSLAAVPGTGVLPSHPLPKVSRFALSTHRELMCSNSLRRSRSSTSA